LLFSFHVPVFPFTRGEGFCKDEIVSNELTGHRLCVSVFSTWREIFSPCARDYRLEDHRFWPDLPGNDVAYVHRIAVRRQFAGQGVSTGMLEWPVNHAAALGRSYLRLDCEADRRELRSIYERFGFRLHSYRDVGPYHLCRYEYVIVP
jgi:GNAT superfamily N-acetyltransferase